MTLTTLSSDLAIIGCWIGTCILLSMAHVYRATTRALRRALRLRSELDAALDTRRAAIRGQLPQDAELGRICRAIEAAITTEEQFDSESELDRWIHRRLRSDDIGNNSAATPDDLMALKIAASDLRQFRDRYNDAVAIVNSRRRALPGALIARSLIDADLPPLPDPDLM